MRRLFYWLAAAIFIFSSCSDNHLITDSDYRRKVENDFNERKTLAASRAGELFTVFESPMPVPEKEALQFLFAYMPLSDLADYTGQFFLSNATLALRTRQESTFGKSIPDDIFLHYVLPPRVNNENLDSFRIKYYNEINSRISGMDPLKAALEINYWCHEKVAYMPADIRTSAPLSTILSARGRCGEESTFTVAALRTAGIPARQVYTPRWAHSDDNHAWVEFWADGKWYYMGACEPDAVPDRGWFTEPARRAMLIHTKSFGAPYGKENNIVQYRDYSVVNSLSKYAITRILVVKVTDAENRPVSGASVEYQLYNYAEFYPLAVVETDNNGISRFETGLGDLMIWAHKGDQFGYKKISVSEIDTLVLSLKNKPLTEGYSEYDLGVPLSRTPFPGPPEDLVKQNNVRVQNGNNIRKAYISSWIKPSEVGYLTNGWGLDSIRAKQAISRSMGNYREILDLLKGTGPEEQDKVFRYLELLADKDLRDTRYDVLKDHLEYTSAYENSTHPFSREIWFNYVLNPRIANEILSPWRKYFFEKFSLGQVDSMTTYPEMLIRFVGSSIIINDEENYYRTPITPIGVDKLKVSDSFSRDIYFVAICRSLGIPARLEPGTNRPQYYTSRWVDVYFNGKPEQVAGKGYIKLVSSEKQPVPEYYIHFTLAKFNNGKYNTLEYDFNRRITDFRDELELDPGFYMLMTGNRISDSKILTSLKFFELKSGEHRTIEVILRKDNAPKEILGKLDMNNKVLLSDGKTVILRDIADKGLVLTWIEPDKEPTRHIFNDLPLLRKELDAWGGTFLFLTDPSKPGSDFNQASITGLPEKSIFGSDTGSALLAQVCGGGVSCSTVRLPLMILADRDGNILFRSEGYRIGIGEQILRKTR